VVDIRGASVPVLVKALGEIRVRIPPARTLCRAERTPRNAGCSTVTPGIRPTTNALRGNGRRQTWLQLIPEELPTGDDT